MPPIRTHKQKSIFWQVFFGIIAAMVTLYILGVTAEIAFLAFAVNTVKTAFETAIHKPAPQTIAHPVSHPIDLSIPITATQKIIKDMGKQQVERTRKVQNEAIAAAKNRRPMRNVLANDEEDMPPWEHPHKWGKISSEHGTCWHHYDTMRKVCE